MIGGLIAWQAVRERRNIVCELIGAEAGPFEKLINTYRALGYHISMTGVTADLEQSLRWNQERSDDNIFAYHTEPFHLAARGHWGGGRLTRSSLSHAFGPK